MKMTTKNGITSTETTNVRAIMVQDGIRSDTRRNTRRRPDGAYELLSDGSLGEGPHPMDYFFTLEYAAETGPMIDD